MTTHETLPLPTSTYQLLLDAAGTWPDGIATLWIPDPADYTRCLSWTYAELAGTVTRIANALTALGVRRPDAVTLASVNTSMLYAAHTHASQLACGRGIVLCSGLAPGEGVLGGLPLFHVNAAAAAVGRPDRHSGEVPVAYVVPAAPGRFDEAELVAWASTAIDEPAARPKRIYAIDTIPVTAVGKHFKSALAADAAVRAVTEALTAAGLPNARATAMHEDGRLVVTVTGVDPGLVREAVAGFALTVRSWPSSAAQTAAN